MSAELAGLRTIVENSGTLHEIAEDYLFDVRHYYADGSLQCIQKWYWTPLPYWHAVRCSS